ncbi:E3 ubiquitin-protein ligase ZNRF1 [Anastrepha obliqua]|uniref:E3 ubiquitin-protein ligase ZNRF1 n=1 Tax=Anastrepha ludens TaxID=28586 RepID=UPI0023AF8FA9|nr:E3 ubiquitin-protein ligase ZNRF1 [Anastrepha ludens]XP_053950546.1 E3 ubiquitin-protein ligase ZNRF1 [Anastrepha ludens]XP_053950547.1 E3 ubiquitin-protein ligase ZNRF1 [Anastrepha ludens]XP_054727509.1 E3 ubiquitin-protein ligase ZNRF1 [Anastrepha obliqua]XP_054727510.1 E3 ubiquitin-protein ligase ZNRF1 [Anastrepha obliqua]
MGAKASTPTASGQSPRSRTFSSSSTGTDAAQTASNSGLGSASTGADGGQGFNLLRTLPSLQVQHHVQNSSIDRQRARSLSSVPDIHNQQHGTSNTSCVVGGPHTHPAVSTAPSSNAFGLSSQAHSSAAANYLQHQHYPLGGDGSIRMSVPVSSSSFHDNSLMLNGGSGGGLSAGGRGLVSGPHSHTLNFEELQDASAAGANFVESIALAASSSSGASGIGRVYTATSLPSHIWSFNGIKCPVCNKFVLPDDIECHLVMCLTKPRLSYNEDVLSDAKGECVICLEDLNPGDIIARLPCLCIYHKGCIDRWFEVNRSCPEHPGD